jgi:hypothetical protein
MYKLVDYVYNKSDYYYYHHHRRRGRCRHHHYYCGSISFKIIWFMFISGVQISLCLRLLTGIVNILLLDRTLCDFLYDNSTGFGATKGINSAFLHYLMTVVCACTAFPVYLKTNRSDFMGK